MLVCVLAAAALPAAGPAVALTQEVEAQAQALRTAPVVDGAYLARLDAFAARAMALSDALRASGAPQDLACIFRGISEDARARAAEIGTAQTPALRALARGGLDALLDDAAALAPIARRALSDS